jgi:hypothetical protein
MPLISHHDILRREYTYKCLVCGETVATITEEQIVLANNIMDLMPTEAHTCKPKDSP